MHRENKQNTELPSTNRELVERIMQIDSLCGRRFARLKGVIRKTAAAGIMRHLRACLSINYSPNKDAIREILDDIAQGRTYFDVTSEDKKGFIDIAAGK